MPYIETPGRGPRTLLVVTLFTDYGSVTATMTAVTADETRATRFIGQIALLQVNHRRDTRPTAHILFLRAATRQ